MSEFKNIVVIETEEVEKAVKNDIRALKKIVVPSLYKKPEIGIDEVEFTNTFWTEKTLNNKSNVILSKEFGVSYALPGTDEKPHWHRKQIESYFSTKNILLAYKLINHDMEFKVISFRGRVFIPEKTCHYVVLTGLTEVIELPASTEKDKVLCDWCSDKKLYNCSAEKAKKKIETFSFVNL